MLENKRTLRQPDGEDGSLAWFAFDTDAAAVIFNNVFGDGESKTGTAHFTGSAFIQPVKTFEYSRELIARNPGAVVSHFDFNPSIDPARKLDSAPFIGVFNGIIQ